MGFRGNRKWLIVFLAAVAVRGLLFLQVLERPSVIFQPDSRMYVGLAEGIRQHGTLCYPDAPDRPDVERMPGYPVFLAVLLTLFGGSYLAVIAIQALLDSLSCLLVGVLGERVWSGSGLPAGLLAAVNLNMLTYSLFVLNDSLFLLIFLAGILVTLRFMDRPSWQMGALAGALVGLGTLVRPVIFYFPLLLLPFLLVCLVWRRTSSGARLEKGDEKGGTFGRGEEGEVFGEGLSFARAALHVFIVGCSFAVLVVPWLTRNYALGGRFQLTSQAGEHLTQYVVPFVWQYSRGIPFIEGMKKMNRETAGEVEREGVVWNDLGPFEKSERRVALAVRILREEPPLAIAKAWAFGMAKNLFAPAVVDMSYLLGVERPHFFYTEGKTLVDRGVNFVKGIKGWFGWAVVGSLVLMPLVRLVQLWGLIRLFGRRVWVGGLFALIIGYFLLISGPVGYAKYRLPFEPVLIVLLTVGVKEIAARFPFGYPHGKHGWTRVT